MQIYLEAFIPLWYFEDLFLDPYTVLQYTTLA